MASFQTQVMGLTDLSISSSGTNPTEAQLTQFLTDGAKEVINNLPIRLLPLCSAEVGFTSGSASPLNTGKILNVFRNDGDIKQPCRRIAASEQGRAMDDEDMNHATITDPVYYIDNNSLDVIPDGGSCTYSEVAYPAVAYSDAAVSVFPDEAEYLVVLYSAVKSLQNVLGSKSTNSAIDTAIDAANVELDKIVTDINIPVAPAISTVSYTDATNADAAQALVTTATASVISKADISVDVPTFTKPAVALDFAQVSTHIDSNEDTELASSKINQIQAQISEYNSNIQNEQAEFSKENVKYQANVQSELSKHNSDLQVAITNANNLAQELRQESSQATDVDRFNKTQDQALNLSNEAKQMESLISDNNSKMQKYSNELQSYQAEVAKLVQGAQGYIGEVQSRLQVNSAQYSFYEKQQAKLQADYDKGLQSLNT